MKTFEEVRNEILEYVQEVEKDSITANENDELRVWVDMETGDIWLNWEIIGSHMHYAKDSVICVHTVRGQDAARYAINGNEMSEDEKREIAEDIWKEEYTDEYFSDIMDGIEEFYNEQYERVASCNA